MFFAEDPTRLDAFFRRIDQSKSGGADYMPLDIIEWPHGDTRGTFEQLDKVSELQARNNCSLRVVFAPLDYASRGIWLGQKQLFEHYRIPSAFHSERVQSVTTSFGSRTYPGGVNLAWFHFLCDTVRFDWNHDAPNESTHHLLPWFRSDERWHKPGIFLKWESKSSPAQSDVASSQIVYGFDNVELCCFGAPDSLQDRFQRLGEEASTWREAMHDPFILFDIVLDELNLIMQNAARTIQLAVGKAEEDEVLTTQQKTFGLASGDKVFDFVSLSRLSKHVIYLKENCDGAIYTAEAISQHHARYFDVQNHLASDSVVESVEMALKHRRGLFQSMNLQLTSVEKRIQNLTNLAFNLVTQQSTRTMMDDSRAMKTVAVTTLIFLPIASIAAIFSTPFFTSGTDSTSKIHVTKDFWILWIVAVPVTTLVVLIWSVCLLVARERAESGLSIREVLTALSRRLIKRLGELLQMQRSIRKVRIEADSENQ